MTPQHPPHPPAAAQASLRSNHARSSLNAMQVHAADKPPVLQPAAPAGMLPVPEGLQTTPLMNKSNILSIWPALCNE